MGNLERRLEALEGRVPAPEPPSKSEARERMKAHLDRVAALRRGELDPEETAEVEALTADIMRRLAQHRGEGRS